jgi:hypothetical protein
MWGVSPEGKCSAPFDAAARPAGASQMFIGLIEREKAPVEEQLSRSHQSKRRIKD